MRGLRLTLSSALVALAPTIASAEIHGLVIGIDAYDHIPSLDGAANDARDITDALSGIGGEVTTLIDEAATRERIFSEWRRIAAEIGPGDLMVVSYAGHGSNEPEFWSGNEFDGRDETLLLSGFAPTGPNAAHRIRDDEIADLLALVPADQMVFVADACHAGTVSRSVTPIFGYRYVSNGEIENDPLPPPPPNTKRDEGRGDLGLFLAAVDEAAKVPEFLIDGEARGALSYAFADALRGGADLNDNGELTLGEIEGHVRRTIRDISHGLQQPQIARSRSSNTKLLDLGEGSEPDAEHLPVWAANFDELPEVTVATTGGAGTRSFAELVLNDDAGVLTSSVGDIVARFQPGDEAAIWRAVDKARLASALMAEPKKTLMAVRFRGGDRLYRSGEIIEIEIANRAARHVTMFNIGSDGQIAYLYPIIDAAAGIEDPRSLSPTERLSLPLRVAPPFGADHVFAIETEVPHTALRAAILRHDGHRDIRAFWNEIRAAAQASSDDIRLAVFPFHTTR